MAPWIAGIKDESARNILSMAFDRGRFVFVSENIDFTMTQTDITAGLSNLLQDLAGPWTRIAIFTTQTLSFDSSKLPEDWRQMLVDFIEMTPIEVIGVNDRIIGQVVTLKNA